MSLYSKEGSCSSDESDGEEKEAREVLFITHETQNDEHRNIDTDETNFEGECINDLIERQKKINIKQETLWETEDDMENEQEEIEKKLRYVEEDILKLRNINKELNSELNYELEEQEIPKEKFE